jgi:HAE1 family hydrophobic/amphiphilic exporter-1
LEITDLSAREVEEVLLKFDDIESYIVEVGRGSQFGSGGSNEKLASATLLLKEDRVKPSSELLEDIRVELSQITSAAVRVFQPSDGPPTGAPILVKFFGDDLDAIAKSVEQAEELLKTIPGTAEVDKSTKNDALEFSMVIDRARASQFGLTPSDVAFTLRTSLFGTNATTIKANGKDIDVLVKLDLNQGFTTPDTTNKTTIDAIENIELLTPSGNIVLLGSIVKTSLVGSNEVIRHEDRERIGSASAQVAKGSNTREVLAEFTTKMEQVELPEGVVMSIGGETEDSNQAFIEMGLSLIVGMIAILSILVLQFQSYRYALYILAIIPFTLIGVFTGLAVSGQPLSFPSMMGFIALSGIVVNNSIILIDRMNKLRVQGLPIKEVVVQGATSRLRPIILTTVTTVIGITPLIYTSELWGPLAFAIIFGLSFAVFVTLILVPMLYFRWPGKLEEIQD